MSKPTSSNTIFEYSRELTACLGLDSENANEHKDAGVPGDVERGLEILKLLKECTVSFDILKKTKIGILVNKLRKHKNSEVKEISGDLVRQWKSVAAGFSKAKVAKQQPLKSASMPDIGKSTSTSQSPTSASSPSASTPASGAFSLEKNAAPPSSPRISTPKQAQTQKRSSSSMGSPPSSIPRSPDNMRSKVANLFINAFVLADGDAVDTLWTPADIGQQIEEALYNSFKPNDPKYKQKAVSLSAILKKNTEIQTRLLNAVLLPKVFVGMRPEEFLTEAQKEENRKIRQYHFDASRTDWEEIHGGLATTDQFKCGKCLRRECTYTQKQTRSADEPMTTFVYCTYCKNRWKFC